MIQSKRLQSRIGHTFSNQSLFEQALSHRSVGSNNNEKLEFLGDAILGYIISEALYEKFPALGEGELTRVRSLLVRGETLGELGLEFELGDCLFLGEGELKSGGFRRVSILADAIEALVAAIYLDAGLETCKRCVLAWFETRIQRIDPQNLNAKDPKTALQEHLQKHRRPLPTYHVVEELGEAHSRRFSVECRLADQKIACVATDTSKRSAEKLAAKYVLEKLGVSV